MSARSCWRARSPRRRCCPKWFLPFLGILAALLLLWFLVLRPIVHNDAVNASKTALAVQAAQTKALANQVAAANQAAKQANATAAAAAALAARGHKTTTTTSTTTTTVVKAIVKKGKAPATTTTTSTTVGPRDDHQHHDAGGSAARSGHGPQRQ